MNTPKISVIVPVYKVEKYLATCVKSIVAQTFTDIEIILVDDGSPDNCGKMCDEWAKKDSRIKVIHKENGGLSDARNHGMEQSSGEYVIFIDSDDYIEKTMLEILYNLIVENDAQIAICGAYDCYENYRKPTVDKIEKFVCSGIEAFKMMLMGGRFPAQIWNKLIKRELAENNSFLKGKTYEDAFYSPKLFFETKRVAVTTEPLYNYIHRTGSITTKPFTESAMDIIEAYEYTYDFVCEHCPEFKSVALLRLQWANFIVLDRLLLLKNCKEFPQYRQVIKYLKKNWLSVFKSTYFRKGRRISAIALKISVRFYKILSTANSQKLKEIS